MKEIEWVKELQKRTKHQEDYKLYRVSIKKHITRYTYAKSKEEAKENVCWFDDIDKTDILSCEEVQDDD